MLEGYSCARIFYHTDETQPQPTNYTGAPPAIVTAERARPLRAEGKAQEEQEHADQPRRGQEVHDLELDRKRQSANTIQMLEQQTHALCLAQHIEEANARDEANERSASLALRIKRNDQLQTEQFEQHLRYEELQHESSLAQQRNNATGEQNRLALDYQDRLLLTERESESSKLNSQRKA